MTMDHVPLRIQKFAYDIVYYVLWAVEMVLFLRFLLKLLGANPYNSLVSFLYSTSRVLMGPFDGMFGISSVDNMVLEPSVLVAMVFYALAAYALVTFIGMITPANKINIS